MHWTRSGTQLCNAWATNKSDSPFECNLAGHWKIHENTTSVHVFDGHAKSTNAQVRKLNWCCCRRTEVLPSPLNRNNPLLLVCSNRTCSYHNKKMIHKFRKPHALTGGGPSRWLREALIWPKTSGLSFELLMDEQVSKHGSDESCQACASQRRISNKSSSGLGKTGYHHVPSTSALYSIFYLVYQSTATHLDCRFCLRLWPAAHASCDLCVPSLISNVLDSQGHHGKGNVLFNFESFLLNGSLEWDGI